MRQTFRSTCILSYVTYTATVVDVVSLRDQRTVAVDFLALQNRCNSSPSVNSTVFWGNACTLSHPEHCAQFTAD